MTPLLDIAATAHLANAHGVAGKIGCPRKSMLAT
jgi:hypothetical protein